MGAMQFKQRGREEQAEADGIEAGEKVAKLLGVDCQELYKNLLKPRIKVGNEFVTQGRNKDQVYNSIGALCKGVFDRIFRYLVMKCNATLDTKQKRNSFIGVLDIAGFEIFDVSLDSLILRILKIILCHFISSTVLSNFVLTLPMKSCNNSSTITCSSWNRKNIRRKVLIGLSLISVWTCWLVLNLLKR